MYEMRNLGKETRTESKRANKMGLKQPTIVKRNASNVDKMAMLERTV